MESRCDNIEVESVKHLDMIDMVDMIECEKNCLWKVSLDSAGAKVSELEAGWRILVGKEFQRKGAVELKERLPV